MVVVREATVIFVNHLLKRSGDHSGPGFLCRRWCGSLRLRKRRDEGRSLEQLVALLVDEAAVKGHVFETAPGSGCAKGEPSYERSTHR